FRGEFKYSEPTSFVLDINNIKKTENTVSVMFQKEVEQDKNKLSILKDVQSNVNIILNAGVLPKTLEEAEAIDYFNSNSEFKNKLMVLEYQKAYIRETRRLFGDNQFDYVYNYDADSDYWNSLLEAIKFNNTSTIRIY